MFIVPVGAVALFLLLVWALRPRPTNPTAPLAELDEPARPPATYFGLIRRAMSDEDFAFLTARASGRSVRRAHKERQRVALLYLSDLRVDFRRLMRLARVIAVLSPEVAASHEVERLRLSMRFFWRYHSVQFGLYAGLLWLPQLSALSQMVAELARRMESAMKDLGERAAVAAELASTLNRRGLGVA
jgi:hypothetical protein